MQRDQIVSPSLPKCCTVVASYEELTCWLWLGVQNSFERVGFTACFSDRSSKRRKTQIAVDARHLLQQQLKAEQMFAVLLEKRKQLVRDELALALLPRRAPLPIE